MANEISVNFQFKCNNPAGTTTGFVTNETYTKLLNQNALGANAQTVSVPTTTPGTTYTFPNLATPGFLFLQNLDATNYVTYGILSGGVLYALGKIEAGEMAFFRMNPGITFAMLANTAAVNINYLLLND